MANLGKRTVYRQIRQCGQEFAEVDCAIRALDGGRFDHMFRDAETKAALRADLNDRLLALVTQSCEQLADLGEVVRVIDPETGTTMYCGVEAAKRQRLGPFANVMPFRP